jgi:hypothetical protein
MMLISHELNTNTKRGAAHAGSAKGGPGLELVTKAPADRVGLTQPRHNDLLRSKIDIQLGRVVRSRTARRAQGVHHAPQIGVKVDAVEKRRVHQ